MKGKKVKAISLLASLSVVASMNAGVVHAQTRVETLLNGMSLDQKIEQMLMPDFRQWQAEGESQVSDLTALNNEVAEIIDQYDFGGVILFANNVKETEQTLKLTTDMQNAVVENKAGNGNIPLLLSIDQEGGIVYRLGSGTALPGNMAIGATDSVECATLEGEIIGSELDALGINVNFGPVLDTNNNPNNPVIGLRSISSNPDQVAKLGVPMMQGMQKYNVATAAKHFPGHGDTATDSHTGLPIVNKTYEEISKLELVPFQAAVDNGVDMLMTAHIAYPQIEKDTVVSKKDGSTINIPATLSDDIITGIVRNKMKYDGIVVTDALGMDAISENFGESEAVIMAMKADVDICLMPTVLRSKADVAKIDKIINDVKAAVNKGDINIDTINKSVSRILTLKEKRGILDYSDDKRSFSEKLANANEVVGSKKHHEIEREISAKAVTVVKNDDNMLPIRVKENEKVLLISAWPNEQPGMELAIKRMQSEGVIPKSATFESCNYSPVTWGYGGTSIDDIKHKIDNVNYVVVISEIEGTSQMNTTAQGNWESYNPTEIIKYANSVNKPAVLMSIAKPYDVANYPDAHAVCAVYGWVGMDPTEGIEIKEAIGPNIPAGIDVIFGKYGASGKLPVDVPKCVNSAFTDEIAYKQGFGITYDALNFSQKDDIASLIEKVENTANDNYTEESWKTFQEALQSAKNILADDNASQIEVDDAATLLSNAYNALTKKTVASDNNEPPVSTNDKKNNNSIKTGDDMAIVSAMIILLASGLAIPVLRKKEHD